MKRSIRMLIIAIVVLALLGGAYFFAVKWEPKSENTDDSKDSSTSELHYLTDLVETDIVSVDFKLGDVSYSIKNGEEASIEGFPAEAITSDTLKSVVLSCSSIIANRKIDPNGKKLSDYGLENSDRYITINLKDGTSKKVIFGNSAYVDGEYYAMEESDGQICTITSYTYEALTKHPSKYRDLSVCNIDNTTVTRIALQKGEQVIFDIQVDDSDEKAENAMMLGYKMLAPYTMAASGDKFIAFVEKLGPISAVTIADENPSDLAQYGLDVPYMLTVTDATATNTLYIGKMSEDGVYMRCNDLPVVYVADCTFYDSIITARTEDYLDSFIHLFNIENVSKITVEQGGKTHTLSIKGDTGKDGNATYKVDDKNIDESKFKKIYQSVIGVTFSDVAAAYTKNDITCTIKFDFKDKSTKTFYYYRYDERNSAVTSDAGLECITLTKNLTTITEQIENALTN